MIISLQKTPFGLQGDSDVDRTSIDNLKPGYYMADIKRPRNPKFHRKFFALLNIAFGLQTQYGTIDALLDALKIYTGHFETYKVSLPQWEEEGVEYICMKPRSISFAQMDGVAFEQFYDRCLDVIIERFVPESTLEEMDKTVTEYLSFT